MKFFKIICFVIVMLLLANSESLSQDSVIVNMTLSGRPEQKDSIPLQFGIKKGATNGLDLAMGEKEIPPFFPPTGLDGRLVFEDSLGDRTHSYKDFKGFANTTSFTIQYYVVLQPSPQRRDPDPKEDYLNVYFKWDELSPYIDSAFIRDPFKVINVNMKDTNQFILSNEFIDDLIITVHYNFAPTSVNEYPEIVAENGLYIYPNPTNDELFVKLTDEKFQYKIVSITGNTLMSGNGDGLSKVDVSSLPRGVYALAITGKKTTKIQQFIKQ